METSASRFVNAHNLCSPLFVPTTKRSNSSFLMSSSTQRCQGKLRVLEQSWRNRQLEKVVKCAKGGSASVPGLGRPFGDEIITEEELIGTGKLRDNCEETRGIAELLECLEREAIMGEDEGKEPIDYNRRAQIFDKSSRVFQALKESSTPLA